MSNQGNAFEEPDRPHDIVVRTVMESSSLMLLSDDSGAIVTVSSPLRDLAPPSMIWQGRPIDTLLRLNEAADDSPHDGTAVEGVLIPGPDQTARPVAVSRIPIPAANTDANPAWLYVLEERRDTLAPSVEQTSPSPTDSQPPTLEADPLSSDTSRFLAAMGHEVRTPMNVILGFTQLLQHSEQSPKHQRYLVSILTAGRTLMNRLSELMDLDIAQVGSVRIYTQPFALLDMLRQVADDWEGRAQENGAELMLKLHPDLPKCIASDPLRLRQILDHLLSNAIKYGAIKYSAVNDAGQRRGGRITLSADVLRFSRDQATLRFSVQDTGPGMTDAEVRRLFRPFSKGEGRAAEANGGWGLGLAISRTIADSLTADIGVDTAPNRGSLFHLTLTVPVEEEASQDLAPPSALTPPFDTFPGEIPTGLKVLVAEQNALNQDLMRAMLQDAGQQVYTVASCAAAVAALQEYSFDVVILDISMPGLGGMSVAELLTATRDIRVSTPFLFCAAYQGSSIERSLRTKGITDILVKPVGPQVLQDAIARVTQRLDRGPTQGKS